MSDGPSSDVPASDAAASGPAAGEAAVTDPAVNAIGATRDQRRQVIRLKRAGFSREAIVSETGVAMDDVIGIIGPEGATPVKLKLDGNWRRLGTSDSGSGRRPY